MKVSLSWLREYVAVKTPAEELARKLTLAGLSVEAVEELEGDSVLVIDVPSNRPDCLSILGIAREVALLTGAKLKPPPVRLTESQEKVQEYVSVEVADKTLCPRYIARVVRGVKVGPSPEWIQKKLRAVGVSCINNIVDITNYVLFECGQPLHAFDLNKVRDGKVVVRRARQREKMAAIDGKEYALLPEDLVIADVEHPVAIAGVMGGKESEISEATIDVFIESAQFDPVSIRRTSRRLALSSDSSYRFERGVDFETVEWASRRAAQLMKELAGGNVCRGAIDCCAKKPAPVSITLRPLRISRLLGTTIPPRDVKRILTTAGFAIRVRGAKQWKLQAPAFRRDVRAEVDVLEELARIYGYDKIPTDTALPIQLTTADKFEQVEARTKQILCAMGFYEVLTPSFMDAFYEKLTMDAPDAPVSPVQLKETFIAVINPAGKIEHSLRSSLTLGFLSVLRTNVSYRESLLRIFEISKVYSKEAGRDYWKIGLATTEGFTFLKGIVEKLLEGLGICGVESMPMPIPFCEDQGIVLKLPGSSLVLGHLGSLATGYKYRWDIKGNVSVGEFDFKALKDAAQLTKHYQPFPRLHAVRRDVALVADENLPWLNIETCIRKHAPAWLESLEFFDLYHGKNIPAGKKSVAFSLHFRSAERTLTSNEVERAMQKITDALHAELGATLRQ